MSRSPGPQIEIESGQPRSLMTRIIGLALLISAAVLATYLVVAYFAWQSGQQTQLAGDAQAAALLHQVDLARQDAAQGSTDLALRRLDWVLSQDGGHSAALALQNEIQTSLQAEATMVPTNTPEPADDPPATVVGNDATSLPELAEIRRLIAGEAWGEALPAILAFQQRNPDFERGETDKLLYETYLNLGLTTIIDDGLGAELGLNYLSQAERLGTLPQEAEDYRYWANLYLDGISYYGVNWEVAGFYFRDLCAAAPFYRDSCQLLNEILTKQADQLAFTGDWCPAEVLYQELWQQNGGAAIEESLSLARENCALATPVPLTNTVELTGTLPLTDAQPGE